MKKLVLILVSVLFAIVTMAQTVSNSTTDFNFDPNSDMTYYKYTGSYIDSIGIVDSTWAYVFGVNNRYDALKQEVRMKLDEVAGTGNVPVVLQGKTFVSDAWTTL